MTLSVMIKLMILRERREALSGSQFNLGQSHTRQALYAVLAIQTCTTNLALVQLCAHLGKEDVPNKAEL